MMYVLLCNSKRLRSFVSLFKLTATLIVFANTLSCTKADPKLEGTSSFSSPTYQGKSKWDVNISSTTASISFTGECDKRITKLEASADESTWVTTVFTDSNCSDGNYNLSISDISQYLVFTTTGETKKLYIRGTTAIGKTNKAVITVNYTVGGFPNVDFATSAQSISESTANATVSISLNAVGTSDVTIPYTLSGTATAAGTDYNLINGSVVITAGLTTGSITIPIVDDVSVEAPETIIITLGAPTNGNLGATTVHTVTINDNDFGAATQLVFSTQPANSTAGQALTPVIQIKDALNQVITTGAESTANVTLSLISGTGTLSGTLTKAAVNGVVTFTATEAAVINLAGAKTLRATYSVLTVDSNSFTISHAAASQIVFTTEPADSTAGQNILPVLQIRDTYGNVVDSGPDATANVTLTKQSGNGTLSGTLTKSATAGIVSFGATETVRIDLVGSKVLRATKADTTGGGGTVARTVDSTSFTISHAAASQIAFVVEPVNSSVGQALLPQIKVLDAYTNIVTTGIDSGTTITLSKIAGTGTLTNGGTSVTLAAGQYTYVVADAVSFDTAGTGKQIRAHKADTSGSGGTVAMTADSATFDITNSTDLIDDDNSVLGFNGGNSSGNMQWNTIAMELSAAGLANLVGVQTYGGEFTSRIMDGGSPSATWSNLKWTPKAPYGKPLPNNQQTETLYNGSSNASMSNNGLLFHFEETTYTGTVGQVIDSSANAQHGTSYGAPITNTDSNLFGKALDLIGSSSWLSVPTTAFISPNSNFSIEFWFKPNSTINSNYGKASAIMDKGQYSFEFNNQGKLSFNIVNSGAGTATVSKNFASTIVQTLSMTSYRGSLYAGVQSSASTSVNVIGCTDSDSNGLCDSAWSDLYTNGARFSASAMIVYNDVLYVGFGDNWADYGSISYCNNPNGTGSTANLCDGTEFVDSFIGTNMSSVNTFAIYKDKLYAFFTANSGTEYGKVCNPAGGTYPTICEAGDWSTVAVDDSFPVFSETYTGVLSAAVLGDKLYVGMGGASAGRADVYMCTTADGICNSNAEWVKLHDSTATWDSVTSLAEYNGNLYIGLQAPSSSQIKVCDSKSNTPFESCNPGDTFIVSFSSGLYDSIESMAVYKGKLYAGTGWSSGDGTYLSCNMMGSTTTHLCEAADWTAGTAISTADSVGSMYVFNNKLYMGTYDTSLFGDIYYLNDTTYTMIATPTIYPSDSWTHVALRYDNGSTTAQLYINGALDTSLVLGGALTSTNLPLVIGKRLGTTSETSVTDSYFNGKIDELAFFNRTLSASEIQEHYRRGAVQVKYQVMSCDDAACAGETWTGPSGGASYYSEFNNSTLGLPNLNIGISANQYFRYRMLFETRINTLSPEVYSVELIP